MLSSFKRRQRGCMAGLHPRQQQAGTASQNLGAPTEGLVPKAFPKWFLPTPEGPDKEDILVLGDELSGGKFTDRGLMNAEVETEVEAGCLELREGQHDAVCGIGSGFDQTRRVKEHVVAPGHRVPEGALLNRRCAGSLTRRIAP